ncbi:MAG: hypothetical protein HOE90_14475 [Bacteriovoracaceae bacterium]|nr:hypothetical protein [Bacteriovoracaceae bacterium]
MAKRKKRGVEFNFYNCTITGRKFKIHGKAQNPDDLVSVGAYYELHPEEDDRPELEKKQAEEVEYFEEEEEEEEQEESEA